MKIILPILLLSTFFVEPCLSSEPTISIQKETGLKGWKLSQGNFQIELIQRSPQQTRSFFLARGFSAKIANEIATQCVFQTIVRNTQLQNKQDSISVSLKDWRLQANGKLPGVKLKEQWDKEWQKTDISTAARVAFRWATFPTEQQFSPGGDFNWGMISFGLKPETRFDLDLYWKQGDTRYNTWIKSLQCPADKPE